MKDIFKKTDKLFWEKFPELKGRLTTNSESDEKYRKDWMNIYVSLGGAYNTIGNMRIASCSIKDFSEREIELFKKANDALWGKYPIKSNIELSFDSKDAIYREFWMDNYIQMGGNVFQIGKVRIAVPK